MESAARTILCVGILLVIAGGSLLFLHRLGIPFGNLPGDFHFEGKGISFFFPLGSSIALSILLSVLLTILLRIIQR